MKKLVGGDYLLDLTPIELEESEDGETYTNITNKEIIEQLTNLKKFVPNPSMVKPVWVKLKNGETDEIVVVRGEFKVVDANEFEIVVAIDGYKLKIHIEFTQATLSDDTPIDDWYIDTNDAKYLFTSDAQNINALVNAGEIDNAKPLYWHGIEIVKVDNDIVVQYLQIVIINNSSEQINTAEKLVNTIRSFGNYAFVQADGFTTIDSTKYHAYGFYNLDATNIRFCGADASLNFATEQYLDADLINYLGDVTDRMNKLN